jgi:4-hydroxybenzoate polyprenyltransferase
MARPSKAALAAPPERGGAAGRSAVALLAASLRPGQWTKNLFVLAGLLFGRRMLDPDSILLAASAFVIFCALSSAVYLFNDVMDREADRVHPLKSARPIASGALAAAIATSAAVALGAGGIAAAVLLRPMLGVVAAAYVALLMLYSVFLKHMVIVDVLTIAAGFVLRAVAGALAVSVPISHWLLVCTTLLALFLALSKRRHELTILAGDATEHRRILQEYSPYLLDQMVGVVTASTLVAYAIYATSTETAERLGTDRLGLTIPFVLYGIFRYLYLVHQKRGGGSPAELLLADRPLLLCVGLWGICVVLILYTPLGR